MSADLVATLRHHAATRPDALAIRFLTDGDSAEETITYAELDARARRVAAALAEFPRGERVLLLYPPGLDYVAGFYGCLYAGLIAVPAYPPDVRVASAVPRLLGIVADAAPAVALTLAAHAPLVSAALPAVRVVAGDALPDALPDDDGGRDPAEVAFLQYTSGSTAAPRGVMVTQANLVANLAAIHGAIRRAAGPDTPLAGVIWLPPYHDMGLIGGILQPVHHGFPVTLFSPIAFVRRPRRWLQAISRYRGVITAAPNFAFALALAKTPPEERASLDLSSLRIAFAGAEPLDAALLAGFADAFAPAGLRADAIYPCYGLAESTLIATGGARPAPITARRWQREGLTHGVAIPSDDNPLVACGAAAYGHEQIIVDPETRAVLPERQVGEIWLRGPSVAAGYWRRPDDTATTFGAHTAAGDGPWLRTGDLGFRDAGELFVTGRAKDLIIVDGMKHHPHDLEQTVAAALPALRAGSVAAFAIATPGGEAVAVIVETDFEVADLERTVRVALASAHALPIADVIATRRGAIRRTSSGKIARHACRAAYLDGTLAKERL